MLNRKNRRKYLNTVIIMTVINILLAYFIISEFEVVL